MTVTQTADNGDGTSRTHVVKQTLDGFGRVTQTEDRLPDGTFHVRKTLYDSWGRVEREIDKATNLAIVYTYDSAGNVTRMAKGPLLDVHNERGTIQEVLVEVNTYQAGSRLSERTKWGARPGERWVESYDSRGRMVVRQLLEDVNGGNRTTQWKYQYIPAAPEGLSCTERIGVRPEACDEWVKESGPAGLPIVRAYNSRGQVLLEQQGTKKTTYQYDAGKLTHKEIEEGSWRSLHTWSYNAHGQVVDEVESWRHGFAGYRYRTTTTWEIVQIPSDTPSEPPTEATGRHANVVERWEIGNWSLTGGHEEWHATRTETRLSSIVVDGNGNIISRTQAGLTDKRIYAADGRLMVDQPASMAPTEHSYAEGLLVSKRFGDRLFAFVYDGAGRIRSQVDPLGHETLFTYWPWGALREKRELGATDVLYTYDGAGFMNSMTVDPDGEHPRTTSYAHGAMGELLEVELPSSDKWVYEYFPDRLLKKISPPAGAAIQMFDYDGQRRQSMRTRGNANWYTSWSNGVGTTVDPVGNTMVQLLDGRGRVARTEYTGSAGLTGVKYAYDGLNQLLNVEESNTLSGPAVTSFAYDGRSRVTRVERTSGRPVDYAYTNHGSGWSRRITASGATPVDYSYDGMGQLVGVTAGTNLVLSYLPGGLLSNIGNGSFEESYSYNGRRQLMGVETWKDQGIVTYFGYNYDSFGNRLTETYSNANVSSEVTEYGYDKADRLTGVRYPDGNAVLYALRGDGSRTAEKHYVGTATGIGLGPEAFNDPVGTLSKHLAYSFDARDGLSGIQDLVSGEVGTIVQDAAGRMTHYEFDGVVQDMVWDAADRMVSITHNGQTNYYSYDWRNWRTEKVTPLETVKYTWGVDDMVAEEAIVVGEAGPRSVRSYLQGPRMGLVLGTVDSGGVTLFGHDALGSVVAHSGEAGTVGIHKFDAWGVTIGRERAVGMNTVSYSGHNLDYETGMTYAKARYLRNELGRWLSEDPLWLEQGPLGLNPFQYAFNNPLRYVDADGRDARGLRWTVLSNATHFPHVAISVDVRDKDCKVTGEKTYDFFAGSRMPGWVPGAFSQESGRGTSSNGPGFTIYMNCSLTCEEDNKLREYFESFDKGGPKGRPVPKYKWTEYNCADFIVQGLKQTGLYAKCTIIDRPWYQHLE